MLLLFVVVVVSRVLCVLHQAGGWGRLPLFPLCATERRDRGRGRRERVRWEGDLAKGGRRCVRLLRVSFLRGVPGGKIRQSMQSRQIKWVVETVFFLFIISEFLINSSISYVGDFFLLFGAISSRANDEKSFLILLRANWCGLLRSSWQAFVGDLNGGGRRLQSRLTPRHFLLFLNAAHP